MSKKLPHLVIWSHKKDDSLIANCDRNCVTIIITSGKNFIKITSVGMIKSDAVQDLF